MATPILAHRTVRLQDDAGDRAALLGVATLRRLTYDYPTSDRLYSQLSGVDSLHPNACVGYALLGRAWSLEERGRRDDAGDEFARVCEPISRERCIRG